MLHKMVGFHQVLLSFVNYMSNVRLLKKQPALTKGLFSLTSGSDCPPSVKKITKVFLCTFLANKKPQSYIHSIVLYLTKQAFSPEYWYM